MHTHIHLVSPNTTYTQVIVFSLYTTYKRWHNQKSPLPDQHSNQNIYIYYQQTIMVPVFRKQNNIQITGNYTSGCFTIYCFWFPQGVSKTTTTAITVPVLVDWFTWYSLTSQYNSLYLSGQLYTQYPPLSNLHVDATWISWPQSTF